MTFITSSMNLGGAERQLLLLCQELTHAIDLNIISLDCHGPLLEMYKRDFPEIKIIDLQNIFNARQIINLRKALKRFDSDLVVTWLYKADILGGIVSKSISKRPVIWSVRNSDIPNLGMYKKFVLRMLARIIPTDIVSNGLPAQIFHTRVGYPTFKFISIPNLVAPWTRLSMSHSRLLDEARGINDLRIGIAARQVEGKGILESIDEIVLIQEKLPEIKLLLIGQKTVQSDSWVQEGRYSDFEVHHLTGDEELSDWFADLDLLLMPSTMWESQPNSLIEAMAIKCPVLISNVIDLDFKVPTFLLFNPTIRGELSTKLEQISRGNHHYSELEYQEFLISTLKVFETKFVVQKWLRLIESRSQGVSAGPF